MERASLKENAINFIEGLRKNLCDISFEIHSHPEVAYQEVRACRLLKDYLAKNQFSIEDNVGGIETAFRASFRGKTGGPTIAFLAEYDALPGIGHACGHNLIAAGAVGAFIATARVLRESDLTGKIEIIGTPAEEYTEGKAGKIRLLESNVFDNIDACLMFHTWTYSRIIINNLAFMVLDVTFEGKAAHSTIDPWSGLNALDGVVITYNGLSVLRQQMRAEAKASIIITEGGTAANIIPEKARARIMLRSPNLTYLDELSGKVAKCIEGASIATETKADIDNVTTVYNIKFNKILADIVSNNFRLLGIKLKKPEQSIGSTDFGNVSHLIPGIHFYVKTHESDIPWHSTGIRDGSTAELAHDGMIAAAKILAMSAIDIMADPKLMEDIRRDFSQTEANS